MSELRQLLENIMDAELQQMILSNPVDREKAARVKVRPVAVKGRILFQETLYRGTQVFHSNHTQEEMVGRVEALLKEDFRQGEVKHLRQNAVILVSKKGKLTIKSRRNAVKEDSGQGAGERQRELSHNRTKQYILKEGEPVDFLVGLSVQTPDGRIAKAKYDKFRQINRYLEFIEDVLNQLPADRTIRIIDFGCGKSYLTFAMYYYLHVLQRRDIQVTGLDLKADVIDRCNELAERCGYDRLHFEKGDISSYTGCDSVDMVVSLHACDTATDYAIEKAVKWGAKVILAVPCCQHEVNRQIQSKELAPLLKYGLIKERMSALITDAVRANLLEEQGYDTQILEFIDMEHTPKNLLIRAVKRSGMRPGTGRRHSGQASVEELMEGLQIRPTLKRLFDDAEEGEGKGIVRDEESVN